MGEVKNIYWKVAFWCWVWVLVLVGVNIAFIFIYTVDFKTLYPISVLAFGTIVMSLFLYREAYSHIV